MFPGGMNPKQMKLMMSRFGIKSDEIPAERVVIYTKSKQITIEAPEVMRMVVPGQGQMYSISGGKSREEDIGTQKNPEVTEDMIVEISDEDVKIVAEQTGTSQEDAKKVLIECGGDIAEAIIKLKTGQ